MYSPFICPVKADHGVEKRIPYRNGTGVAGQSIMNIYFAGAIRGGRNDAELYLSLIQYLNTYGTVLTEHVGDEELLAQEHSLPEEDIFRRDLRWLADADLVIAEVSTPSLGVGYELAVAEQMDIPCFCLFRKQDSLRLSAMIGGNPFYQITPYENISDAKAAIKRIMHKLTNTASEAE
jgi:2'-deoxynucleoside 5'-phosphate N-hydrolase